MLPEKNRLKGSLTFEDVKKKGKMYQSDAFGLLVRQRNDNNPTKFGIVVSNRVSKKAVDRNRIKRELREALRNILDRIKGGADVVILTRKGLLDANTKDIEKDLKEKLKEASLL